MQDKIAKSELQILHVLTLNGRKGEYGGPVRVARELCGGLNNRGHKTQIFSGALFSSEPSPKAGLNENYVLVKPLSKKFPVSSLWSWKLAVTLTKMIKKSDGVHIHFARDLIPFLAALVSIVLRKPFVTQTHGMIISDQRFITRLIDVIFTRPLINRSNTNLVLTPDELNAISKLKIKSPSKILPNGIIIDQVRQKKTNNKNRIVFCSRLNKRKGIDKFVELANHYRNSGIKFDVYGPDGGELNFLISEIISRKLNGILEYKGAVNAEEVQQLLQNVDLLVLPSKDEPFPMVILEALSVGTSVLVMPSCGISTELKKFKSYFVSKTEDLDGLIDSVEKYLSDRNEKIDEEIVDFCKKNFSIESVCTEMEKIYESSISLKSRRPK